MDAPTEIMKWFATLGVGGVLAGIMFFFYRKDMQTFTDQWKGQSDLLIKVVQDNTSATTKNNVVLDALHRRLDRDEWDKALGDRK